VALRARGLRKSFPTGFVLAVDEIVLQRGKLYSVVGPNGAGKTVLLEALSLLSPAEEGSIELFGEPVFPARDGWAGARRRMAMVLQRPYLFRGTVADNVAYGLRARGVPRAERRKRVKEALARLGLSHLSGTDRRHLSGGETQRVALAQALVLEPDLLLLDEPTAHVDAEHAAGAEELLHQLRSDGRCTVLMATHDLEQACRLSDEIYVLVAGTVQKHAPENCFLGAIVQADGGSWFESRSGLRFQPVHGRAGPARIFVDPESILISRQPPASHGRDGMTATVRAVEGGGGGAHRVRVALNGVELTADVTGESIAELKLVPGEDVHLTLKSTGVRVYPLS